MAWRETLAVALAGLEDDGTGKDGRERLRVAAHRFWSARYSAQSWSLQLREQADAIAMRLLVAGVTDRTIDGMNAVEIREASQELVAFCKRMAELPV
jgi:hypothetical protein